MNDYRLSTLDYSKLRGRIVEKFGTQRNLALATGLNYITLSNKLTKRNEFSQSEIEILSKQLDIPISQIHEYFFCRRLEKTQEMG